MLLLALTAAAAIAQGIAGAVQQQQGQEFQAGQNTQNRALQTQLAQQALAEQKRQNLLSTQQNAANNLVGQFQAGVANNQQRTAQVQTGLGDMQSTLARAYLGGGQ